MKNNQIYPDGTFEDIISFPFNADRIIGIVVGVVLLSGMFFLATTDSESMAPKKFANEKLSLSEIWSEENIRAVDECRFCFPYNFSDHSWNVKSPEYNPETKQFIPNNVWN